MYPENTNTLSFYFCIIQTRTKCYCLTNSFVLKKWMFNVDHNKREKLFYEIIKDYCKTFICFQTIHHIIIKIIFENLFEKGHHIFRQRIIPWRNLVWGNINTVMGNKNSLVKIQEAWFERPQSGWLTDSNWRDNREIFASKKNKKVSCRICSIWLPIRHHLLKIQWHQVKSFPWKQIFFLLNKEKRSNLIILLQDILKLIVGFWSLCARRKAVSPMLSCYLNLVGWPSSQL